MSANKFDYGLVDSQATSIKPIPLKNFDLDEYQDYVAAHQERNKRFCKSRVGIAVHRRFRVYEVYSYGSQDIDYSLCSQLGALQESMKFKMDIPNFLEPWYGIGTTASAFGIEYIWAKNQAPSFKPKFSSVKESLSFHPIPIEKTRIGKKTMEMTKYFLDSTKGKIPISLCDVQSPCNVAASIVEVSNFYLAVCLTDISRLSQK